MKRRVISEIFLVNGSTGDPCLYVDYPGRDDALLFDAGDNGALSLKKLRDLKAVFITHHHIDHFIGFDRILRANIDSDKVLWIYGPPGTIERIQARIRCYEYQFFPFQKLIMRVHDLHQKEIVWTDFNCKKKFAQDQMQTRPWPNFIVFEDNDLIIEALPVSHTVPCLAYAMKEKPGYCLDSEKLKKGLLRPGGWIQQALHLLRAETPLDTEIEIDGGMYPLRQIATSYFTKSAGSRVVYITDTTWEEKIRPKLIRLARGADRLYCDAYYAQAQNKQAIKYGHLTAKQAAQLAKDAKVKQLHLMHFAPRYYNRFSLLVNEAETIFPNVFADFVDRQNKREKRS